MAKMKNNNVTKLNVKFKHKPKKYKLPLIYYNTFPMFEVALIEICANHDEDIYSYFD